MSSETVLLAVVDGVATITLNAPDRLNAVDAPMIDAALAYVQAADADPAVRVIALTGAGRAFCAGANLAMTAPSDGQVIDDSTLYAAGRLSVALMTAATPTISLIGGVAAGVGVSFALACDYSLATESAIFVLAFANIGLMPDGGATALVTANVGRAKAMRMALLAEKVGAATADSWGLISECVPDAVFADRSAELIQRLALSSPAAAAQTSAAISAAAVDLDTALQREEREQSMILRSSDFREGVRAFLEKRPPHFSGE